MMDRDEIEPESSAATTVPGTKSILKPSSPGSSSQSGVATAEKKKRVGFVDDPESVKKRRLSSVAAVEAKAVADEPLKKRQTNQTAAATGMTSTTSTTNVQQRRKRTEQGKEETRDAAEQHLSPIVQMDSGGPQSLLACRQKRPTDTFYSKG